MPSADTNSPGSSTEELGRLFSELRAKAETGEWEAMIELAREHDRLLRTVLTANPGPQLGAYLESIHEDYARLLDAVAIVRAGLRDQIKLIGKGRKAVAAYR